MISEAARAYNRRYYEANRETIREQQRKYNEANKETAAERHRRWREANREAVAEKQRQYREANREKIRDHARQYHAENKGARNARQRQYNEANRDAILAQRRQHYEVNREAMRERARRWRAANAESKREGDRRYYQANLEKVRRYQRQYREANREMLAEQRREQSASPAYMAKVNEARTRTVEFTLLHASRKSVRWTAAEDELLLTSPLSLMEMALQLGRTYAAVNMRRVWLRSEVRCQVEHCLSRVTTAGLCGMHLARWKMHGDVYKRLSSRKSHCKWGHPMVGSNVYISPDGKSRYCRECADRRRNDYVLRKRAA